MTSQNDDDILLLPLTDALRALRDRAVHLDILAPTYPCAGVGELRVVRVIQDGTGSAGPTTIVATYQDYERLGGRER